MIGTCSTDVDALMRKASAAAAVFGELDQEHTDRITRAVFEAGYNQRVRLAKMAAEETGIGRWQDKVVKNVVATSFEVRKLVYIYLVRYAEQEPDLALLSINTFQKVRPASPRPAQPSAS